MTSRSKPGETSNAFIAWSWPTGAPYNPTPIVYGDLYYTLFDRGFFTNHDAHTGKEIYARQRITSDASGFTTSPWAYNGKIFAMSEEGDTYVIQAGPEFKVLGKNSLNEMTLATPAVAGGSLIVRTASRLYRISKANKRNRPQPRVTRQIAAGGLPESDGAQPRWRPRPSRPVRRSRRPDLRRASRLNIGQDWCRSVRRPLRHWYHRGGAPHTRDDARKDPEHHPVASGPFDAPGEQ